MLICESIDGDFWFKCQWQTKSTGGNEIWTQLFISPY